MGVDYLGIHIGTLEYVCILLLGLIIFLIIFIATEKQRRIRHKTMIPRKELIYN